METNSTLKKCPYCAEDIRAEALKCKHCGEKLTTQVPPDSPENSYASHQGGTMPSTTEKIGYRTGQLIQRTGVFAIAALIAAVLIYNYNQNHSSAGALSSSLLREKTPEELRAELVQKEKVNPQSYLEDQTTMRTNLLGEKVIEGTVTNRASVAIYKDIVLNVGFMSKTEADLGAREFTVYEVVAPGHSVHFKFKTIAPSDTKAFSASVSGAAAAN